MALIWLSAQVLLPSLVAGQTVPEGWDRPVNLSSTSTHSQTPSIAADPSGMVHVVWTEEVEEGQGVIFYSRLERGTWTTPMDVLLPPGGGMPAPVLQADAAGNLHVVWGSGGSIYYSRAYAPAAGSAHAWSEPQALVLPQNYLGPPDLEVGAAGSLYVAFARQIGDSSGIYLVRSADGGRQWSAERSIYENPRSDRMVDRVRLAIAPDGTLHAVWMEANFPETFPPLGIRYASSGDGGKTWSEGFSLADGPYDWPEIVVRGEREVHVVWSGTGADRFKFHRWSADGGQTWSDMWRNTDLGGIQGWPALALDSSGKLHWLMVGTVFSTMNDSLYYSTWSGSDWSPGIVVLPGIAITGQNPAFVSAAVVQGNELHVVLQYPLDTDERTFQNEIFYLHRFLDSRAWTVRPLPSPTVTALSTATSSPSPQATATVMPLPTVAVPTLTGSGQLTPLPRDTTTLLVLASAAAATVVGLVVVIHLLRRRRGAHGR